jgi:hypothetical protein
VPAPDLYTEPELVPELNLDDETQPEPDYALADPPVSESPAGEENPEPVHDHQKAELSTENKED